MKSFLSFLAGILVMLCVAASPIGELITIKPALPTSTVVFSVSDDDTAVSKIKQYVSQGYVVKTISTIGTDSSFWYKIIVVMEKY